MHLYSSKCGSACPRSRIYYNYFVVVFVMFNRTIIQIGLTIWFEYSALYITCRSVHNVNKPHPSQILVYIWPEQMLDGKFKLIDYDWVHVTADRKRHEIVVPILFMCMNMEWTARNRYTCVCEWACVGQNNR